MKIFCNFVKPEVVSFDSVGVKPCHRESKDADFDFRQKHEFSIEVYCENCDDVQLIVVMSGVFTDMTCVQSRTECAAEGYGEAVSAACSGYRVDSLCIITDVAVSGNASLAALSLAWKKIFCITCQCMTYGFGKDYCYPAIYFDFSSNKNKELIVSLIPKYEDGDVRSEWVNEDCLFIHKIPWKPGVRQA